MKDFEQSEFSDESGRRTRSTERGDQAEPVASPSPDQSSDDQYLDYREEWQAAAPDSVRPDVEGRSRENFPPSAGAHLEQGNQTTSGHPASQDDVYAPITGPEHPEFTVDAPIPAKARGFARSVEVRESRKDEEPDILRFRLDRYDASGNRLAPVGVEMRRYRGGQLTDGDEVEVTGSPKDGTLIAKDIVNLTTGSKVLGGFRMGAIIFLTIILLLIALVWIFIASNIVTSIL